MYKCAACERYHERHRAELRRRSLEYYYAHREVILPKMKQRTNDHKQERAAYDRMYYNKHKKEIKQRINMWKRLNAAKCYSSRRNLGNTLLHPNPFDNAEQVANHHVTDEHIVYLPTDLHSLYNGPDREVHRENLQYIVDQIYGGDSHL